MNSCDDIVRSLTDDWDSVCRDLCSFLDYLTPDKEYLLVLFTESRGIIDSWASTQVERVTKKGENLSVANDAVRKAVIELLLWQLLQNCESKTEQTELQGALWKCLEPKIEGQAKAFAKVRNKCSHHELRHEDLMQEGFLHFRGIIDSYSPGKSMLRTYASSCYRNRFINIAHEKAVAGRERSAEQLDFKTDDKQSDQRDGEELERHVNQFLDRLAESNPDEAERVDAFRKHALEGIILDDVRVEMGRSIGWVHKSYNRIQKLLQEELCKYYPARTSVS